jgi:DNA invertase Pin-like site-specific DNA recombinase
MINVYAAVAQEERRMISDRTKAGLAAAKARGVKLGGPRLPAINETRQADALEQARAIAPIPPARRMRSGSRVQRSAYQGPKSKASRLRSWAVIILRNRGDPFGCSLVAPSDI